MLQNPIEILGKMTCAISTSGEVIMSVTFYIQQVHNTLMYHHKINVTWKNPAPRKWIFYEYLIGLWHTGTEMLLKWLVEIMLFDSGLWYRILGPYNLTLFQSKHNELRLSWDNR
jgi:hypothetical protein